MSRKLAPMPERDASLRSMMEQISTGVRKLAEDARPGASPAVPEAVGLPERKASLDRPSLEPRAAIIERGRNAASRVKHGQHFHDWVAIGHVIAMARSEAMTEAHANRPFGPGYRDAMRRWYRHNPGFDHITDPERSCLCNIIDNLAAVERWREALPESNRHKLNHPQRVWRGFCAATKVPDPNAPRKPSPMAALHDRVVAAEERADAAEKKARQAGGGSNIDFETKDLRSMGIMLAAGLVTAPRIRQVVSWLNKEASRLERAARAKAPK